MFQYLYKSATRKRNTYVNFLSCCILFVELQPKLVDTKNITLMQSLKIFVPVVSVLA